jgi:hypothetical protein
VLLRRANLLFLLEGVRDAVRLCVSIPFRRVEDLFPPPRRSEPARPDLERAAIAYALTERLLRSPFFPFRRTCLRRSLVLAHLLRRSGIEVHICFGVREGEASLHGHSWLSREGRPFLESGESWREYSCVFTLPRIDGRAEG